MRPVEFDFWEAQPNQSYKDDVGDFGSSEIEFQVPIQNEDAFYAYSPPLWKTSRCSKNEVYPLLPQNHRYSNVSPRSRMQAITKGRRELMEMIDNMPESSYELSLRDLVEKEIQKEAEQDIATEETLLDLKTKTLFQKKQKKNKKTRQISRTGSMDNTTFLLKIFLPASLTAMNSTAGKRSKAASRSSSFGGPESRSHTDWWKRFSLAGKNKGGKRNSSRGSTSSNSSNSTSDSSRNGYSNFFPGCWPTYHSKKSKTWGQKGCLF